jgi:hypothetical protein
MCLLRVEPQCRPALTGCRRLPLSGPGSEHEDAIVVGRIRGKLKFGLLKSGTYSDGWPRTATGLIIHWVLPGGRGRPRRAGEAPPNSRRRGRTAGLREVPGPAEVYPWARA